MQQVKNFILQIIDFFYPPFSKLLGRQTFRYLVSGGSNAALNLAVFSIGYNLLFTEDVAHIMGIPITRYIASYMLALAFSFPIGFLLNKYIVFQESDLKGYVQLMRYGLLTATNIFLDYALLHLLIGHYKLWATGSQAFIIVLLSLFSYFCQTYFSFKTTKKKSKLG